MTSTILFNGVDLSKYIRPLWNVDEQIVPDFNDDAIPVGNSDGKLFRVRSVAPRTITIPYYMIDPTQKRREEFAGILNVDEPKQLVFFDRSNEYYLAVPEGGINVGKTGWNDKSELVFTCYDPFRHSLTTTTVTTDANNQLLVNNQGTATTYPIITATMKSENGLVAFANDKGGVLQFGDPEEVDKIGGVKSDKVINYAMKPGQTGFTANIGATTHNINGNGSQNVKQGTVKFDGDAMFPVFQADDNNYWQGPSMNSEIPINSLNNPKANFSWQNRFGFSADVGSVGWLEYNLTAGDKVVASFSLYDNHAWSDSLSASFTVNGTKVIADKELSKKDFASGFFDITITRNGENGMFNFSKINSLSGENVNPGASIQVPFINADFTGSKIDGMNAWFQKLGGYRESKMYWSDSKFTWINVPWETDIPNRFDTGDVVTVDVASRKVYLNGVVDNTLQTVGNQWESFALQPGQTTIQPVASSWATMYDCKLTYREAWL